VAHQLSRVAAPNALPDPQNLPVRVVSETDIASWLGDQTARRAFVNLGSSTSDYLPQAVSGADSFALYAIARGIEATNALEIGTHLGISTVHIAAGLSGAAAKLATVDICDVNDPVAARYKRFGSSVSARERAAQLGLEDRVHFVVSSSHTFLKRCRDSYDLIFIDGSHSEIPAYFDILYSLRRLRAGGVIVLHDVNDPDDPTTGLERRRQYGVYWALHRLRSEFPSLTTIRLRTAPLPGVKEAVPTTLAIVSRAPSSVQTA
jgi:predicted O-methyltransferase YrrM